MGGVGFSLQTHCAPYHVPFVSLAQQSLIELIRGFVCYQLTTDPVLLAECVAARFGLSGHHRVGGRIFGLESMMRHMSDWHSNHGLKFVVILLANWLVPLRH